MQRELQTCITGDFMRKLLLTLIMSALIPMLAFGQAVPVYDQASDINVDTSGFSGNLSSADDTVQKALDTIDAMSSGGGTWGSITGTLSSQTDLQNALNAKQNSISIGTTTQYFRGDLSLATFPTALSSFTNDSGYITSYTETSTLDNVLERGATSSRSIGIGTATVTGVLTASGNVGIGTTSPSSQLHVDNTGDVVLNDVGTYGSTQTLVSYTGANSYSLVLGRTDGVAYTKAGFLFTISATRKITGFTMDFGANSNNPSGTGTWTIETVSGGYATGTLAHANATKNQNITASATNTLTFDTPFELATGTYCALVTVPAQTGTNQYWSITVTNPGGYTGGDSIIYQGAWSTRAEDYHFTLSGQIMSGTPSINFKSGGTATWTISSDGADSNKLKISDGTNTFATFVDNGTTANIGIGTTAPTAALYVIGTVSADALVDRTEGFTGNALTAVAPIKNDAYGDIDHTSLPETVRVKLGNSEGRDLGKMISVLTVAIQQLDNRVAKLKLEIEKLTGKSVIWTEPVTVTATVLQKPKSETTSTGEVPVYEASKIGVRVPVVK